MERFNFCRNENSKRYKKMILIILVCLLLLSVVFSFFMGIYGEKTQQKSASIVMEVSRQKIISCKNSNLRLPMASTTKIMTAYLACISNKLDEIVTVDKDVVGVEGSSIYLQEGEKYKLIDLVYGLMLRSGNDSAECIAKFLGGSVQGFVQKMNEMAKKLDLKNTNFKNPHGLHDDEHYTSAYDLAKLTCIALNNQNFATICKTKAYYYKTLDGQNKVFVNKNKLLNSFDCCIGVKTGYTKKAGRCLVSAGEKNGVRIVSVVLNDYDMWQNSKNNLLLGFDSCKNINLAKKEQIIAKIKDKNNNILNVGTKKDINFVYIKNDNFNLDYKLKLYKNLPKIVNKGQEIGEILFFGNNHLLFKEKIYNI